MVNIHNIQGIPKKSEQQTNEQMHQFILKWKDEVKEYLSKEDM